MIDLSQARLTTLAVHKVGSKVRHEGIIASKELFELDEQLMLVLQDYFLTSFKAEEFYKFTHETDLEMNEIYSYCKDIFSQSREEFVRLSTSILTHLYAQSVHPHIKSGELYVAHFRECVIDDVQLEAIGIFKSENKATFLKFGEEEEKLNMTVEQGVPTAKLDKGCLIFNTYPEDGYSVLMVDRNSEDTQYWREDFLHVERMQDNSLQTQQFLHMTKDFCEEIIGTEQDRKEQVVFLNRSLNYFAKNEEFDLEDFKDQTMVQPDHKVAFDSYRESYEQNMGLVPAQEGFPISKYAVRRMKKEFKSIIKLDTQIEIKLTGRNIAEAADYMERGFDEQRQMYFYKVYFNEEED